MPGITQEAAAGYQVAIDTGGTFTDVAVRRPDGSIFVWKVSSSPSAPDDAVIDGLTGALAELDVSTGRLDHFVHGTTVATNTVITRTGARVGLVTTEGFADLLAIGNQTRPSLYDQTVHRTEPLVPQNAIWEVRERIAADGSEILAVDRVRLADSARSIRRAKLDVVVVSLLNAYVEPEHERVVAEYLRANEVAPSVFAATSITPEMREYERTSTAVVNGYVQPRIAGYLDRLETRLRDVGVRTNMWVMQSNGGLLSPRTAQLESARTVMSGLAGGVVGAARWARLLDLPNVVSFDIGGTSTDIALIREGRPDEVMSGEIDGLPLRMPMIDVHTIGAGGGSIAWSDSGGGLRVGPQSAGAVPGPVCYSRGGLDITVTDAHAVLGRLGNSLLGGRLKLDVPSARKRMAEFAATTGLSTEQAASGVIRVINANMARGVRKVSVERGVDLRECDLIAFGGAGPLHGGDLITELGMRSAVIPPMPGIASAVGMLDAPVRHDFSANVFGTSERDIAAFNQAFDALEVRAFDAIAGDRANISSTRMVDARYTGQSYELTIPYSPDFCAIRKTFDAEHEERYGFEDPDAALEIVTVRAIAQVRSASTAEQKATPFAGTPRPVRHREIFFEDSWVETPIYDRTDLSDTVVVQGPAVIEQFDSTIVLTPTQDCRTDHFGFLHIYNRDRS